MLADYRNLKGAPLPIIIFRGPDLVVEFVNDLALPLLKMSLQEALGTPMTKVFNNLVTPETSHVLYESCFINEQPYVMKDRQILFSDRVKSQAAWFDVTSNPLYDDEGRVAGIISFFTDVSDSMVRKKSINQRDEHYLSNFFKEAPIGIVCYRGPQFIVDLANGKALEMWGKTLDEVKGKPIAEIFPEVKTDPDISKRHSESVEKLSKGKTHIVNEVELTFVRNGQPQTGWYSYIHEPYTNATGEVIGMMAVAIEVTDQVNARRKLQVITDALPALVTYINSDEVYEFANKAFETWFGINRDEVINHTVLDVLGRDAYEKLRPHIVKALSGEVTTFSGWVTYKNSARRFISATYIPHFDPNGSVPGYFGLINDLTDLKKSQEALSDHEERLHLLTAAADAGTFDYDLTTGAMHWSAELKSLFGMPAEQGVTKEIASSVVHPDDRRQLLQRYEKLQALEAEVAFLDYRIIRMDDGATRWMHSRFKVISSDAEGSMKAIRIIGFTIDITERKLAEEQLKEFNAKLEAEVQQRTEELVAANRLLSERNEELTAAHSFLQQLIDSSVEIIGVVDTHLNYIAVNSTFEQKLKLEAGNILGKTVTEVLPTINATNLLSNIKKALSGETVRSNVDATIVNPNMYVETHFIPLRQQNKIAGVIIMARDVTDILKKERQLENVNRQLEEAQQLAKLGSWEWDVASGNILWSDEMYRIYGYSEKFIVDFTRATERMSPEHAERSGKRVQQFIEDAIQRFKATGELISEIPPNEFPITLPDGVQKVLRSSGKIQLSEDGKLFRVLGAIQDVTQIRATEEKLHSLIAELEQKNHELESFNYVASHDLQEPLRKIRTFTDRMISKGSIDEQHRSYLSRIEVSAKRMSDLITSMLVLSRVSNAGDDFERIDLNITLDSCKADLEFRIRETNASFVSDELPTIKASGFQMSQLFSNLIGNSLKFCTRTPMISIRCHKVGRSDVPDSIRFADHDFWCLRFIDNGIGFDPNFKNQIFEPFQRLHGNEEFEGTGIGLSTVKKIVQRHKGAIDVLSEPGKGTEFIVWLPAV
jgi:PAS domain S-box-containing protein